VFPPSETFIAKVGGGLGWDQKSDDGGQWFSWVSNCWTCDAGVAFSFITKKLDGPIPVASQPKAKVCSR